MRTIKKNFWCVSYIHFLHLFVPFVQCLLFLQNMKLLSNLVLFKVKFVRFVGHCVEFNLLGGVIQDQWSSPCNGTFPKCDSFYDSTTAYKCNVTGFFYNCGIQDLNGRLRIKYLFSFKYVVNL